jgi:hypothetical protein
MKEFIKKFYFLFVDRYAFEERNSFWDRFRLTWIHRLASKGVLLSSDVKRLQAIKDIHKGERCFIIGNGPSLNKMDLTKLKNEFTFGVNAIYLNYEKMNFYPTYYAVEDIFVAEDRKDEINKFKEPKLKFFGNYLRPLIHRDDKTIFIQLLRNYGDKKNFPYFSESCVRSLGVGGSVTYVCLELAFHMGFDEVYMIGFDHNYVIPKSALITNERETGFDIMSTEDDPNHFSKDYFGKGYRWHDPKVDRMEIGFLKCKDVYERNGRKLINATVGGKLDVLPRVEYDSLFQ